MTITVIYDIETRDTLLSQNLSDGFTKGSRVQNKISQTLQDLKLEAGKAYTIKLVVGIESVKVTVDVADWDDTTAEQKVDLPYNPEEAPAEGQLVRNGKYILYYYLNDEPHDYGTITFDNTYIIIEGEKYVSINNGALCAPANAKEDEPTTLYKKNEDGQYVPFVVAGLVEQWYFKKDTTNP